MKRLNTFMRKYIQGRDGKSQIRLQRGSSAQWIRTIAGEAGGMEQCELEDGTRRKARGEERCRAPKRERYDFPRIFSRIACPNQTCWLEETPAELLEERPVEEKADKRPEEEKDF